MSHQILNPAISYYATFWSEPQNCFVNKEITLAEAEMLLRAVSVPCKSRPLREGSFEHSGSALDLDYVDQRREWDAAVKALT